jgi:hypothetical protein
MPSRNYPELARKIAAAVVSHMSGAESIDRFLEQNVPDDVPPIWHDLAEEVMLALFLGEQRFAGLSRSIQ